MFKIWARTIIGEKTSGDYMYINGEKFDGERFHEYVAELCHDMDIPTPVILRSHTNSFQAFNIAVFRPSDFVESVGFDKFVLENASL